MQSTEEVWKPVPGHEGEYEVSSLGRVRSLDRRIPYGNGYSRFAAGRILTAGTTKRSGHLYVNLGKGNSRYVHQLVAEAFIGERPSQHHGIRHLNGIPTDNRPENLAWGTQAQNMADMIIHGTSKRSATYCKHGHEFTPENTRWYTRPTGNTQRVCRACHNAETQAAYREKRGK